MAAGDYQSFMLDLTNTSCIDEIIEAMIQKSVETFENTINELNERITELNSEIEEYQLKVSQLEEELVKERVERYEQ